MKNFFEKIEGWLRKAESCFIVGLVLAAFFNIVCNMAFCIWPCVFAAFGLFCIKDEKAVVGENGTRKLVKIDGIPGWQRLVFCLLGGQLIQIFAVL